MKHIKTFEGIFSFFKRKEKEKQNNFWWIKKKS